MRKKGCVNAASWENEGKKRFASGAAEKQRITENQIRNISHKAPPSSENHGEAGAKPQSQE